MYFAPRCLFCNKNNRRRHTRRGRTWKCQHCGEINPGPGMLRGIVQRFTQPPAGTARHPKLDGTATTPAAGATATVSLQPTVVTTTIKGLENGHAATSPSKAAPVRSPASSPKPKPKAKAPAAPPPKKPSFLERVIYGG